jgi:hypothetical protein
MYFVENLKSTQLIKLFKIFKSSSTQSLNIFWAREGFFFGFTILSGVWKFENCLTEPGPLVSSPFPFWPPRMVARSHAPPLFPVVVLTTRRALNVGGRQLSPPHVCWSPLTNAPDVTEEATTQSAFPLLPFGRAPHCSAPHGPPLHPLLMSRSRAVRPGQKECLVTAPLLHHESAHSVG